MKYAKWLAISFVLVLLLGCATTVIPKAVPLPNQASFDGKDQNSGIIEMVDGRFRLTPKKLQAYDVLVEIYGGRFVPAIRNRDGVQGDLMDPEHMVKFLTMIRWHKSGFDAKEVF